MPADLCSAVSSSSERRDHFRDQVEAFTRTVRGQAVVSASRCRDGLLDLYNAAHDPGTRRLIESALTDMRFTNAVRGDQLMVTLAAIDVASLVEGALLAEGR